MDVKSSWIVRITLLIVALSWFSYTLDRFSLGITTQIIYFTDVPATVGLGFRTAAGFIALITILFYLIRRDLSVPEGTMSFRWIVIFEALYFLSFLPSAVWGLGAELPGLPRELLIVSTGLPCFVEATVIPIALAKLFLELNPNKPVIGIVKWAWISGVAYLFVFWFNYSMQWTAALIQEGTSFVTLNPSNTIGFAITVGGLLLLTVFAAVSFKRTVGEESLTKRGWKRIGIIVTAFGLYFDLIILLWILFGYPGGYWYIFFVSHNVDLWLLALPVAGLALLFETQR